MAWIVLLKRLYLILLCMLEFGGYPEHAILSGRGKKMSRSRTCMAPVRDGKHSIDHNYLAKVSCVSTAKVTGVRPERGQYACNMASAVSVIEKMKTTGT